MLLTFFPHQFKSQEKLSIGKLVFQDLEEIKKIRSYRGFGILDLDILYLFKKPTIYLDTLHNISSGIGKKLIIS